MVKLDLIDKHSYNHIKDKDLKHAHLGLVIIGVKGLHRENLGAKVLIYLYDNQFTNIEQGLLEIIELDMNNKGGIIYFTPNYLVKANTFYKDLKIGIKTRGYHMKTNEDNLLICTRFIGRLSENSTTKYKLDNNQMINILGTKGIKAIRAKSFSVETNAGLELKLDSFIKRPILVPEDNIIYCNSDGSINLRFEN